MISATLCCSRGCATASLDRSGRNWRNLRGVGVGGTLQILTHRGRRCRRVEVGEAAALRHQPATSLASMQRPEEASKTVCI